MRRRRFIAGVAGLAAVGPNLTRAQAPASRPLILVLSIGPLEPETKKAFIEGLSGLGLEEGRDFDLAYLSAHGDQGRVPTIVSESVALKPAVIVTTTTGLTVELRRATNSVPIVGSALTDPVGLGLIESYARPGGNVTGFAAQASPPEKMVELLHQIVPEVTRIGDLMNPDNPGNTIGWEQLASAAPTLSITPVKAEVRAASEIERAFQELTRARVGAFMVAQDGIFGRPELNLIASLALAARLPSVHAFRAYAAVGGLMSYGGNLSDRWHHSGEYAARILKGATPAGLPFQQLPKLELVINLKTAEALGLTVPQSLLARADEVIE